MFADDWLRKRIFFFLIVFANRQMQEQGVLWFTFFMLEVLLEGIFFMGWKLLTSDLGRWICQIAYFIGPY